MNNKKIFILSGLIIVLLVAGFLVFMQIRGEKEKTQVPENVVSNFQPEFMTSAEKAEKGISTDLRVQALTRDASGKVMVYKIIRRDSDIKNPIEIKAMSPRQK